MIANFETLLDVYRRVLGDAFPAEVSPDELGVILSEQSPAKMRELDLALQAAGVDEWLAALDETQTAPDAYAADDDLVVAHDEQIGKSGLEYLNRMIANGPVVARASSAKPVAEFEWKNPELAQLLGRSDALGAVLHDLLLFDGKPHGPKAVLSADQASLSMQLATAQRVLLRAGLDAAAMALVRVQFESTTRAVWLASAASGTQLDRYANPDPNGDLNGANQGPSVGDMLDAIEKGPAAHLATALLALKTASWRAMNHYSHGSLIAVVQSKAPQQPQHLVNALLNANGMLLIAANVSMIATGHRPTAELAAIGASFSDCLPPVTGQ